MYRNEKILIIIICIMIIVAGAVIFQKSKQSDLDGNQSIIENKLPIQIPTASSSPEQITNYRRALMSNAQSVNSVSILNDCEPDVRVVKLSPDSGLTFINTTSLTREILLDQNISHVLKPGESVVIEVADLFPATYSEKVGLLAKAYGCKGRTGPVGFIVSLPSIE